MLATQNTVRSDSQPATARPPCPNCGRSMHLARVSPRSDGLSDLRVYRCGECGVSLAQAADDGESASRPL